VIANPKPDNYLAVADAECAVVSIDSGRIDWSRRVNLTKAEAGMLGVRLEEAVCFAGLLLDICGKISKCSAKSLGCP